MQITLHQPNVCGPCSFHPNSEALLLLLFFLAVQKPENMMSTAVAAAYSWFIIHSSNRPASVQRTEAHKAAHNSNQLSESSYSWSSFRSPVVWSDWHSGVSCPHQADDESQYRANGSSQSVLTLNASSGLPRLLSVLCKKLPGGFSADLVDGCNMGQERWKEV